ncbi:MAG: hypothetical protein OEV06_00915 [Anaerolineae bacterium]|nr:hypothetical protein [Anaerolineae bacterium]
MTNPYIYTILIYLFLAIFGALDAALVSYELLPWVNGLRWMRVHLITLGILTQLIFALMPVLVAKRLKQPKQKFRWDIWLMLNMGILALLYGIPLMNFAAIFTGGTLVFTAATVLGLQLHRMRKNSGVPADAEQTDPHIGRKFYISGLSYFLLGIIIGTGLWMGWPAMLRMMVPIEVHIHANNWGLMSLVFAGLLVDIYPKAAGRSLAWPRSITPIFWMMTFGALGLVLGPWTGSLFFTVPGLILHISATVWLLANVIKPLKGDRKAWTPGMWHLTTAYFWILAPISMAPFVILGVPGISGAGVEASAPQALIYGWVLQFGYALVPYFFRRALHTGQELGGTWFSLWTINLGGAFLWASIFIEPLSGLLHGTAYLLWALSFLPIAKQIWQALPKEAVKDPVTQ